MDEPSKTTQVSMPKLCYKHRYLLMQQSGYKETDPWLALEIATQVALFQAATCDPKVHAEVGGDVTKLESLGCLACRKPDAFGEIIDTAQRAGVGSLKPIKELGESWVSAARKS